MGNREDFEARMEELAEEKRTKMADLNDLFGVLSIPTPQELIEEERKKKLRLIQTDVNLITKRIVAKMNQHPTEMAYSDSTENRLVANEVAKKFRDNGWNVDLISSGPDDTLIVINIYAVLSR